MADRVKLTGHERAVEVLDALSGGSVLRFRYERQPWVLISKGGTETAVRKSVAMWLRAQLYISAVPNRARDEFEDYELSPAGRAHLSSGKKD